MIERKKERRVIFYSFEFEEKFMPFSRNEELIQDLSSKIQPTCIPSLFVALPVRRCRESN